MKISLVEYNTTPWILLRYPFNPNITTKVKQLPNAEWLPSLKGWGVPWSPLAAWLCLRIFPNQSEYDDISYGRLVNTGTAGAKVSHAHLHPFQQEGAQFLAPGNKILFDCAGAGKTRQAIAAAPIPALIVCPASVTGAWQDEIKVLYPERTVQVVRGLRGEIRQADYIICSPRVMRSRHKELLGKQCMILDEIHEYRNPNTKMTRAMMALTTRTPKVMGLSGTMVINRVADLFAQLVAIKQLSHKDQHFFYTRYCGGPGKRGQPPNGLTRESELREFLALVVLRRTRADLGRTLPPITYQTINVQLENPAQYQVAEQEVKNWLIHETAAPPEQKMIKLNRLRRLGAIGKVAHAAAYAQALLKAGEKVVIACSFLEPLRQLQRLLPESIRIDGGASQKRRTDLVRAFQQSTTPLVALCSMKAAGIGITLTAARHELILDIRWTFAEMEQMIARIYRETQTRPTTVTCFLGDGTTDAVMMGVLRKKAAWCERLFTGGETLFLDTLQAAEAALLSVPTTLSTNPAAAVASMGG